MQFSAEPILLSGCLVPAGAAARWTGFTLPRSLMTMCWFLAQKLSNEPERRTLNCRGQHSISSGGSPPLAAGHGLNV